MEGERAERERGMERAERERGMEGERERERAERPKMLKADLS